MSTDRVRRSSNTCFHHVLNWTNNRLKGLDFLGVLYEHIVAKQPIEIGYKSFWARRESTFHFSPYLLKEYNNRWFLFGYSHNKETVQNIVLDRIIAVRKDEKYTYVENRFFDPDTYLNEMVGVTRDLESTPELVTLRVTQAHAPYLLTKRCTTASNFILECDIF